MHSDWHQEIKAILHKYWGYAEFRGHQLTCIEYLVQGEDVVAIMPTGAGKSLCYQVPAMLGNGITIVVTPLIALMEDQVDDLRKRAIPAAALHSHLSGDVQSQILADAEAGYIRLLYVSPEKLTQKSFLNWLQNANPLFFAIDEAHCISQWGHDFRPAYRTLHQIRQHFPEQPILALTASATESVVEDIKHVLHIDDAHVLKNPIQRPNLQIVCKQTFSKTEQTLALMEDHAQEVGIVYLRSRQMCEDLFQKALLLGIKAITYHAGMEKHARQHAQRLWMNGEVQWVIATNAFGMGINKPDVRWVVHLMPPESIEEWYQEIGRAGRDGLPSHAITYYNDADFDYWKNFIQQQYLSLEELKILYRNIAEYLHVPAGTEPDEVFDFDINVFTQRFQWHVPHVHHALKLYEKLGLLKLYEKPFTTAWGQCLTRAVDEQTLEQWNYRAYAIYMQMQRNHPSLLYQAQPIDIFQLALDLDCDKSVIVEGLKWLQQHHFVNLSYDTAGLKIKYLSERAYSQFLRLDTEAYHSLRDHRIEKLAQLQALFKSNECRQVALAKYFGEKNPAICQQCDNCKASEQTSVDWKNYILQQLHTQELPFEAMVENVESDNRTAFLMALRQLLIQESIGIRNNNHYYLK